MKKSYASACVILSLMSSAHAANLSFKGTLIIPAPCTINNNTDQEINFGNNLVTDKVDGINYRKDINYTLVCTNPPSNALKLRLTANNAGYNNAIQTNMPNLGIQIYNGNTVQPINQWFNFTYPTLPVLAAVPVKKSGTTLTAGNFTATATLEIDYQ